MSQYDSTLLERASLLLVDDDPGTIRTLARMLSACPNQRFATTGEEALRLARESTPDLILLDAELPDIKGIEVFRQLRSDPVLQHSPVIFVTAHGSSEMESQALELGAADFLNKPVSLAQVNTRVRAQLRLRQLAESRRLLTERLQLALATGDLGAWEWWLDSDRLIWDESMARVRGDIGDRVQRYRDHLAGLDAEDQRRLRDALERALAERRPVSAEYSAMVRGERRWFRTQVAAVSDQHGSLSRLVGVDQDITEIHQSRLALEGANRQLEQFASFASHDLQAPVRRVETYASQAQQSLAAGKLDAAAEQLKRIADNGELMRRQIRSFLDFARHRLSEPGEWQQTDMTALVEKIISEFMPELEERVIDCRVAPLGERYTSPNLVAHIWRNLIGNAMRHSRAAHPRIEIGRRGEAEEAEYYVEDNGVDGAALHRHLEHGGAPISAHRGTGVGITLCRNLLRALGGRLWAEVAAEGGARVLFTLGQGGRRD